MREGEGPVKKFPRKSLRLLGTVGEPINPEAWEWYHRVVGEDRCPIVDTWWQTETGGIMITPLPGVTPLKPGSATLPFFGVKPVIETHFGTIAPSAGLAFRLVQPFDRRRGFVHTERRSVAVEVRDVDIDLLRRIADGQSTKEIAFALQLSTKTVETHRLRLMRKLGYTTTAELVRYAVREGLITL